MVRVRMNRNSIVLICSTVVMVLVVFVWVVAFDIEFGRPPSIYCWFDRPMSVIVLVRKDYLKRLDSLLTVSSLLSLSDFLSVVF